MNNTLLWYTTRGSATVSLVLFSIVVGLGIVTTTRWHSTSWPRFLAAGLHRNLALLSVVFLAIHIVTAVVDPFTALGVSAAAVPFASNYRTFWLGLGVVAVYLMLAVIVTSLMRPILGHRAWRSVHWLSYICWPVAVMHGIGTGTDTRSAWMYGVVAACVAGVVAATILRIARGSHEESAWAALHPASGLPGA